MSYTAPLASATKYGVVKVGSGISVTNGIISASGSAASPDVGYFYSTQTQANLASPNIVTMDGTGLSQGVTLVGGTQLTVSKTANYTLSIMFQFTKSTSAGGNAVGFFWLRKNGVDVPDSASDATSGTVQQGVIASWSYTLPMVAGDYLEMVWYSTAANAILIAIPASAGPPAIPTNPSVRMTLIQS